VAPTDSAAPINKPLKPKHKGLRAARTYRGARRNAARAVAGDLSELSPYRDWRKRWTWCNPGPKTTRVLRGKPKFATNPVTQQQMLVGFHPDFPRPLKGKLYSYAGKC
jgi:hypothetical protein